MSAAAGPPSGARAARLGRAFLGVLAAAVVARMLFHAVFLPAWEGPDEPFHLGRILSFARDPLPEAWKGARVSGAILEDLRNRPCNAGESRLFGCPAFGTVPAGFNLLTPRSPGRPEPAMRNPEGHQPPLFYAFAGGLLRLARPVREVGVEEALLLARVGNVGLAAVAVFWPLRRLARRRSSFFAAAGLLLLSLPGAAEALARCSNDAAVFLWTATALAMLAAKVRGARWPVLLAAGPLLKLTALPVAAVAVAALWRRGERRAALAGAAGAALVVPVQALRGWSRVGTLELNRSVPPSADSLLARAEGLLRSAYAIAKSAFWTGGWSFFPPPRTLLLGLAAVAIAAGLALRPRGRPLAPEHAVGLAVAVAGALTVVLASRRYWGVWGGVGGWYFWSWFPWLAVAAADALTVLPRRRALLLGMTAALAVAANAAHFRAAFRLYG